MKINKESLDLIVLEDLNKKGQLVLKDLGDNISSFIYKKDNNEYIDIDNNDANYKLIRCSELENKLKQRDWNIGGRKYVIDNKLYQQINQKDLPIYDEILDSSLDELLKLQECPEFTIDSDKIQEFKDHEIYKNILNDMKKEEIYLYNTSKKTIDILNNSVTIDAISYNSGVYTNIVNISELVNSGKQSNLSGIIELEVGYVIDGKIKNHLTIIPMLTTNKKGEVVNNNIIEDINKEVHLEFINGIIKVLPLVKAVDECVINKCTVTYGNINN